MAESRTQTLIIRLWPEEENAGADTWRGSVDHVQSGRRAYFQTLDGMKEQIAHLIGEVPSYEERPQSEGGFR